MPNLRMHGQKPFNIAVVHGGPGARGEMNPVAREISLRMGVLEPLQTADSVEGQVEELRNILENYGSPPLVLVGFSWGAWLSFILTANHPRLVKKLILISSPPFEEKYVPQILETRLSHLDEAEKQEALSLLSALNTNRLADQSLVRFGTLMNKADSCGPLPQEPVNPDGSPDAAIFQKVWPQASQLRRSGKLLKMGADIQCPVVAIHGDYDPHPAAGVKDPLSRVLKNFQFILLKECGHHPWLELKARHDFYKILKQEIEVDDQQTNQTKS
jgi:pimeloyl-ACP methyl ester carboxylesterase